MTTTANFPTAEAALLYRKEHDVRVRKLYRMAMPTLRDIDRKQLADLGTERLMGGPVSKDELINAIVGREYPVSLLNESTHVLHHHPGESWPACEFCQTGTS